MAMMKLGPSKQLSSKRAYLGFWRDYFNSGNHYISIVSKPVIYVGCIGWSAVDMSTTILK